MTPPKKYPIVPDTDPDEERYQRKIAERRAFAALLAEEILSRQPPHVCTLPPEWRDLFRDAKTAHLLRSMAAAYAESEESQKTIKQMIFSKLVDVSVTAIIAAFVIGVIAWVKQVSH